MFIGLCDFSKCSDTNRVKWQVEEKKIEVGQLNPDVPQGSFFLLSRVSKVKFQPLEGRVYTLVRKKIKELKHNNGHGFELVLLKWYKAYAKR